MLLLLLQILIPAAGNALVITMQSRPFQAPIYTYTMTLGESAVVCYNIYQPCVQWITDSNGNKLNAVSGASLQTGEGVAIPRYIGSTMSTANALYTVLDAGYASGQGQFIFNLRVTPLRVGSFTAFTNSYNVVNFVVNPPPNTAPVSSNTTLVLNENAVGYVNASAADADSGDYVASASIVTQPAVGTATVSGVTFTYTPPPGWYGSTSFTYAATDSKGAVSNIATVYVTVNQVNHAPVGGNVTIATAEDVVGNVLAPASDTDNDSFTVQIVNPSLYGSASVAGNRLNFAPAPNWSGVTSFTYRVVDVWGAISPTYTVSVTVSAVNDAPAATPLTIVTHENTPGSATASIGDPDSGDTYSLHIVTQSSHGTASAVGNTLTFTPNTYYFGNTSFTYQVRDSGGALSPVYTVNVTVNSVNQPPTASHLSMIIDENVAGTISAVVSDPDLADTYSLQIVSQSSKGVAVVSGNVLTFTPNSYYFGTTAFTYQVRDASGALSPVYTVSVTVNPVNQAPTAGNLSLVTNENMAVSVNVLVSDPDPADTHTVMIISQSPSGTATVSGNRLIFTPTTYFFGSTEFTYQVKDAIGTLSPIYSVNVTVNPVNQAPSASHLAISTDENVPATITVSVNDPDVPMPGDTHTLEIVAPSTQGAVAIVGDTLTFTPNTYFFGATSFTYQVRDAGGALSPVYTVTVMVNHVNQPPSIDQLDFVMNESQSLRLVAAVADPDLPNPGDSVSLLAGQPSEGTVAINGLSVTFVPPDSWYGTTTFTYQAVDAAGLRSALMTAQVTVNKWNYAPARSQLSIVTNEGQPSTPSTPLVTDPNAYDAGMHTVSIVTAPNHGTARIVNNQNSVIFEPAPGFVGSDSFVYRVTDGGGATLDATASVQVNAFNYPPTATTATLVGNEGQPTTPTLPVTDDPNVWDSIRYEIVAQPAHGRASVASGGLVYVPDEGFYGEDRFVIRAIDLGGEAVEGEALVTINPFNYPPTEILPISIAIFDGVGGWATLLATDRNRWDSVSFSIVRQPYNGRAWLEGNKLFYAAARPGATTVRVRASDLAGASMESDIALIPKDVDGYVAGRNPVDIGRSYKIPAVTSALRDAAGNPALTIPSNTQPGLTDSLDRGLVIYMQPSSTVSLMVNGKLLAPGKAIYFEKATVLRNGALQMDVGATEQGVSGTATLQFGPYYGSENWYKTTVAVWSLHPKIDTNKSRILQVIESGSFAIVGTQPADCAITGQLNWAKNQSPFANPTCYIAWDRTYAGAQLAATTSSSAIAGTSTDVGVHQLQATAYVVDSTGMKYPLAVIADEMEVLPITGALGIEPVGDLNGAFGRVQELELPFRQVAGPVCRLSTNKGHAMYAATKTNGAPSCWVEWTWVPDGMAQRGGWEAPYLVGVADVMGDNLIRWTVSVFDKAGNQYPSTHGEYRFTTATPPPVAFSMTNQNLLGGNLYAAAVSGGYVGDWSVLGYNAPIRVQSSVDGVSTGDEIVPRGWGDTLTVRRRITAEPSSVLWSRVHFAFGAEYAGMPSTHADMAFDVLRVPDPSVQPQLQDINTVALSSQTLPVTVFMGDVLKSDIAYSPDRLGVWDVRLLLQTGFNQTVPLTAAQTVDADGTAVFPLALDGLAGKTLRILAQATVRSPVPEYTAVRNSTKLLTINVLNGDALEGSLRGLRLSGEVPFTATVFADLVKPEWVRDLGKVQWMLSADQGTTWQEIKGSLTTLTRLTTTFTEKGRYLLHAVLTNKNSGAMTTTRDIEIIAYQRPSARLDGPTNAFVGVPAVFNLLDRQGMPLTPSGLVIEWSTDKGKTWVAGGPRRTLESETLEQKIIYARLRFEDAPVDDPQAYQVLRGGASFRSLRPPVIQMVGPTRPEVGKPATYRARAMLPYPQMKELVNGYFTLPNGERIIGDSVTITPTKEQADAGFAEIQYTAWVEGYQDKGALHTVKQKLRFWYYDWPDFSIEPTMSSNYAPADLSLRVRLDGAFTALEGVQYRWDLPISGIDVTQDNVDTLRAFKVREPGDYTFRVHVSDARGNTATSERTFSFLQPPPFSVALDYTVSNPYQRAPLTVVTRPAIVGGHPRDAVALYQYFVDGELKQRSATRYSTLVLTEPGDHTIRLRIESMMGQAAEASAIVSVVENHQPRCELSVIDSTYAWTAKARCTDTDGRVTAYRWSVGGEVQPVSGNQLTISKRGREDQPAIVLQGVDDGGMASDPVFW